MIRRWAKRVLRFAAFALGLGVLVGVLGIGYATWRHGQVVDLPPPTGPLAVGRTSFDWTEEARVDPLNPDRISKRELEVWAWYPADAPGGAPAAPYVPQPWASVLDQEHGVGAVLFQSNESVHAHAVPDAPVSAAQARYPVLVLLPGFGSTPAAYTTLAEDLASHGYVVAGVAPTDSVPVVFSGGRVAPRTALGSLPDTADAPTMQRLTASVIAAWSGDVRFTLDQLALVNAAASGPLAGRLDLDQVGVLGHSFGGAAAAEVCRQDARCKAGADVDGTLFGPVSQGGLKQPFLFVNHDPAAPCDASCQQGDADQQRVFQQLAEGYRVTVMGTRHFNFTDYALLFEPAMHVAGLFGPINPQRGEEITRAYVGAFFDHELLGRPVPLLNGPSAAYPEVQIEARP